MRGGGAPRVNRPAVETPAGGEKRPAHSGFLRVGGDLRVGGAWSGPARPGFSVWAEKPAGGRSQADFASLVLDVELDEDELDALSLDDELESLGDADDSDDELEDVPVVEVDDFEPP